MAKKCTPCLGTDLKELLATLGDPEIDKILDKVPDCPTPTGLQLCGITKGKRPRSEYQEFISTCMKERAPNGMTFGEAPQHMKTCAAAWRKHKEGGQDA